MLCSKVFLTHSEHYKGSGFDRGHMAPAGDVPSAHAMAKRFSLANLVPQAPKNKQKSWNGIEQATRKYVMRAKGDACVISGPVYEGKPKTIGHSRVWVPKHLYKLVYDPATDRASALTGSKTRMKRVPANQSAMKNWFREPISSFCQRQSLVAEWRGKPTDVVQLSSSDQVSDKKRQHCQ